jgi:transcriptional regulator GlxA family with amidase domain
MDPATKHIGILLFENVEELDAVGPYEVLAFWTRTFPSDGWDVLTLSRDGGLNRCAKGLVIDAQASYATMPDLDVLIYPGGQGTRSHLVDESQLEWVRHQRDRVAHGQRLHRRVGVRRGGVAQGPTRDDALGVAQALGATRPVDRRA